MSSAVPRPPGPPRLRSAASGGLALVASLVVAATMLIFPVTTGSGRPAAGAPAETGARLEVPSPSRTACRLTKKLVPTCPGALTGAFVRPRPGETFTDSVRRHEQQTETPVTIVHNYYRGNRLFPSSTEKKVLRMDGHRRLLLANWKPEEGLSWRQVADGAADDRIRAEARYLRARFDKKFFLTIHHEPEDEVNALPGSGFEARDYRAMYQRVVDLFRAEGADKVVWVMNYMGAQKWADQPWYDDLYPGSRYVDWIAFDPYKTPTLGGQEGGFGALVNQHDGTTSWRGAYRWATENYPRKPVMMAEWGIGERPGDPGYKARVFSQIAPKLYKWPRLRALVYFDNYDGPAAGDVSITTSPQALAAYRQFVTGSSSLRLLEPGQ